MTFKQKDFIKSGHIISRILKCFETCSSRVMKWNVQNLNKKCISTLCHIAQQNGQNYGASRKKKL